jgi:HAMP domain-containing protein
MLSRQRAKISIDLQKLREAPATYAGLYMITLKDEIQEDHGVVENFNPQKVVSDSTIQANVSELINSVVAPLVSLNSTLGTAPTVGQAGAVAVELKDLAEKTKNGDEKGKLAVATELLLNLMDLPDKSAKFPPAVWHAYSSAKKSVSELNDPNQGPSAIMSAVRNYVSLVSATQLLAQSPDPELQALFATSKILTQVMQVVSSPNYRQNISKNYLELADSTGVIVDYLDRYTEAQLTLPVLEPEYEKLTQMGPGQFRAETLAAIYISRVNRLVEINAEMEEQVSQLKRIRHELKEMDAEKQIKQAAADEVLQKWSAENRLAFDTMIGETQKLELDRRLAHEAHVAAVKQFWTSIFTAPFVLANAFIEGIQEAAASAASSSSDDYSGDNSSGRSYTRDGGRVTNTHPFNSPTYNFLNGGGF